MVMLPFLGSAPLRDDVKNLTIHKLRADAASGAS
jgi:hypothetical protein